MIMTDGWSLLQWPTSPITTNTTDGGQQHGTELKRKKSGL